MLACPAAAAPAAWPLGDVERDAPALVAGQLVRRHPPVGLILEID